MLADCISAYLAAPHCIHSFMDRRSIWVNVSLGGGEFCVAHNLLNDAWRYVAKGEGGGGSVAAEWYSL